ncbi:MAG: hypothetical protein HY093_00140 [Candidatus Liptonbacteria bacterium]|nr:hypothetical protein [Candidatus Liptonbacteria bacterium]
MNPLDNLVLGSPIHGLVSTISRPLSLPFVKFLKIIGLVNFNPNLENTDNPRIKVLFEEAKNRGIKMQSIDVLGKNIDYYLAKIKNQKIIFNGLPRPPKTSNPGLWWMDDKKILKTKLASANIPTPKGESFSKFTPLLAHFNQLSKPVVVKPRLGSRGRHTTTFIQTESDLKKAYKIAKQLCHWVVLEEQLPGPIYRGTVIDGKLVGVLGGDPPKITGDGKNTIEELIVIKNQKKPAGVKDFKISPTTPEFLARLGYTLKSVLEKGKNLDLTEKIGVNYGGSSFEVTPQTHPSFKTHLEKAAQVVGDPVLGFDFIAEDITQSPDQQKWGIIECNSLPFINLHHDPLIGEPVNTAAAVWDLWVNKKS